MITVYKYVDLLNKKKDGIHCASLYYIDKQKSEVMNDEYSCLMVEEGKPIAIYHHNAFEKRRELSDLYETKVEAMRALVEFHKKKIMEVEEAIVENQKKKLDKCEIDYRNSKGECEATRSRVNQEACIAYEKGFEGYCRFNRLGICERDNDVHVDSTSSLENSSSLEKDEGDVDYRNWSGVCVAANFDEQKECVFFQTDGDRIPACNFRYAGKCDRPMDAKKNRKDNLSSRGKS